MWEVEYTDEFYQWWRTLTEKQQEALDDRVMLLAEHGPAIKRPVVGEITSSRHHNMKALRASQGGALRVLFAFDPRRHAILLLGGDKTGQWEDWYRWAIPAADDLYDTYLQELRDEGLLEDRLDDWTGEELMPATKNYRELHEQVASRPGAAERLAALRSETLAEIGLYELRRALDRSQTDLAAELGISQSAISQLERGEDLKLSTLRNYLAHLGARLELLAVFEDDDGEHVVSIRIGEKVA